MGKLNGFLEYKRVDDPFVPESERIESFNEFHVRADEEERRHQGARCMNCGVPLCQSAVKLGGMVTGCPLHNLIPEWNDEIYRENDKEAVLRLLKTNNFPEFTGRVCPALCEKACICGLNGDPVTVRDNELFIIENAFKNGWMSGRGTARNSGKKIAVIGSGPSGLAAADSLCRRGHSVTVFERDDRPGGLLMYGIPNMKLDKSILERRIRLMEEEGVVFITGTDVGKDISAGQILDEFDAVALCGGAKEPRKLAASGTENCGGIFYAVDFLKEVTKGLLNGKNTALKKVCGKHVVIVGGGDTGNDCVGTSVRLGAESVVQLEIMPKPPEVRRENNPWPEWPRILKTDYGQREAIYVFGSDPRIYETTVKEIKKSKNRIKSIVAVKTRFENGVVKEIEGTEKEIPCDLLLVAAGFAGCESYTLDAFGVKTSARGTAEASEEDHRTCIDKVFAAGDMRRGQSLVVWAIAEGRNCARAIDMYLMGYSGM